VDRIRIGISACLLGAQVRYDGGHKRDAFLADTFGRHVDWVSVCPEVEVGLGTPRETLRLEAIDGRVRMVMPKSGRDLTDEMRAYARRRVEALADEDLCGYVLKKDSPSCGLFRVKVYDARRAPSRGGRGLFAEVLVERFPALPVEEEGRLSDPRLRENFVERVFAYRRLKTLFAGRWSVGALVAFHTAHKLALLAHSPAAYTALGQLVAQARALPRAGLRARYEREFMAALRVMATPRRHVNVLMHMAGYLRRTVDEDSRRELRQVIEDYGAGLVPLVVPLTLLQHHVRRTGEPYLSGQVYLSPHPKELMLRNHV
jgi:uncharacterized protein YbgA (DUF1722 family)/uncharacterized protein YbbK (DUF523 family)